MRDDYIDVYFPCMDRCTTVRFTYDKDGRLAEDICSLEFLSSNIVYEPQNWFGRIKNAWKVLTGKPVYYAEIMSEANPIADFFKKCLSVIEEQERTHNEKLCSVSNCSDDTDYSMVSD